MGKRRILVALITLMALLASVLSGCKLTDQQLISIGKNGLLKTYEYDTSDPDYFEDIYFVKTEYYEDKVIFYYDGTVKNLNEYVLLSYGIKDFYNIAKIKDGKIIVEYDNPEEITSMNIEGPDGWTFYYFRYLNSDSYACVKYVYDYEWEVTEYGNVERFYTEEELAEGITK